MSRIVHGKVSKRDPSDQPQVISLERDVTIIFEVLEIHPGIAERGSNIKCELVIYDDEWQQELSRSPFTLRVDESINVTQLKVTLEIDPRAGNFEIKNRISD